MTKKSAFANEKSNKLKTTILIVLFIIFISIVGSVLGMMYGNAYVGAFIALAASGAYTMIVMNSGDGIILKITGAKPVTKQEYPHLFHSIEGLALAAGIPKPKAYVIEDSALNAFATGRDPDHSSVTVTTGLLKKLNRQELEGVIAHEMSHIKNYDIRVMMVTVALVGIIVLLADFLWYSMIFGRRNSHPALFALAIALIVLSPVIAQLIKLAISRKREYLADSSGAVLTRYPEGLASALEKISNDPDPHIESANRAAVHLFISNPCKKGTFKKLFLNTPSNRGPD